MFSNRETAALHRRVLTLNAQMRNIAKEFYIDYPAGAEPEYKEYPKYIALLAEKRSIVGQLKKEAVLNGEMDDALEAEGAKPLAADRWKPIPTEGLGDYEASDSGFIRNRLTYRVYKRRARGKLLWVSLVDSAGVVRNVRVDKLIAAAWLSSAPTGHLAHIDSDSFNCRQENLRWTI